jgi:hypothetical protein
MVPLKIDTDGYMDVKNLYPLGRLFLSFNDWSPSRFQHKENSPGHHRLGSSTKWRNRNQNKYLSVILYTEAEQQWR